MSAEEIDTEGIRSNFDREAFFLYGRVALLARKQFPAIIFHGAISTILVPLAENRSGTSI